MIRPTHIADAINQVLRALRGKAVYPAGVDPKPRPSGPSEPVAPVSHIHLAVPDSNRVACGQPMREVLNWTMMVEHTTCPRCLEKDRTTT